MLALLLSIALAAPEASGDGGLGGGGSARPPGAGDANPPGGGGLAPEQVQQLVAAMGAQMQAQMAALQATVQQQIRADRAERLPRTVAQCSASLPPIWAGSLAVGEVQALGASLHASLEAVLALMAQGEPGAVEALIGELAGLASALAAAADAPGPDGRLVVGGPVWQSIAARVRSLPGAAPAQQPAADNHPRTPRRSRADGVCVRCGGHGHWARDCPNPPSRTPRGNRASQGSRDGGEGPGGAGGRDGAAPPGTG